MKKILAAVTAIILTQLITQPALALTDTSLGDEYSDACARNYVCDCTFSDSSAQLSMTGAYSATSCESSCRNVPETASESEDTAQGKPTGYTFKCDNARGITQSSSGSFLAATPVSTPAREPVIPCLNVPIPGLKFGNCDGDTLKDPNADPTLVSNVDSKGERQTNLLGSYVEAVYQYLLIAAAIVAVTMLMIAGLQYATARGSSKQVDQAKKRINNAIVGIILLLLAYNIAFIINPSTTTFESLSFASPAKQQLNRDTSGPEGDYTSIHGGSGTWENLSSPYKDLVEQAKKQSGACAIPEGFISPAGGDKLPNQSAHHWGDGLKTKNYQKVSKLDWAAAWGAPIYAPVNAVSISYLEETSTSSKCGNQIILKTATGERVTICHAKDFIGEDGTKLTGSIKQGQIIGHLGGVCCAGSTAPSGWYTKCTTPGPACDPNVASSCQCQPLAQAGNTTGPHIHVTMQYGKSNILACMK